MGEHVIPEVKGDYGTCVFQDCLDFLRVQKDKAFGLAITDPPYNDNETIVKGKNYNNTRNIKVYSNHIPNYPEWCIEWFTELQRVSERIIFTCGRNNLEFWLTSFPKTFNVGIWLIPNTACRGYISKFINFDYILFWGNFQRIYNKETFIEDDPFIFEQYVNSGFLLTDFEKELTHPHPKPLGLYEQLVLPLLPIRNILDIFIGSGTIGELGEKHKVNWVGVEKFDFRGDILARVENGRKNRIHINTQKTFTSLLVKKGITSDKINK